MPQGILTFQICALSLLAQGESTEITDRLFHLGDSKKPDWAHFTSVEPTHGTQIELSFEETENKAKLVVEVQAGDVGGDWKVKLNGEELGLLEKAAPATFNYFKVKPSLLKDGRNRLLISADKPGDDIYVGRAFIHRRPLGELKGYARVRARVRDPDNGQDLPSRLTITRFAKKKVKEKHKVRKDGEEKEVEVEVEKTVEELVDLFVRNEDDLAVRKGILYTRKGHADFDLPAGDYTLYATRGFEYGVSRTPLSLGRLEERELALWIRREVDTTGLVAADTHIHTKTYSKHGDIEVEERVLTIAGEGVEVAVATDHNHHTDYRPVVEKVRPGAGFKTVIGNEVTTSIGHFNAFPFEKDDEPPEHDHTQWTRLVEAMRKGSGVRVVIVNHPRRGQGRSSSFGAIRLNPLSGEAHQGPEELGVDAIEVLNGKTLDDNRMLTLNDWFGVLNRGYRVAAVAASDSHSVTEIVGQARSYVASSTDDPRRIRIDEICESFRGGKVLASLGLLTQVQLEGRFTVGDLATGVGEALEVKVTVQGPSWTQADRVVLYLNGIEVRKEEVRPTERAVKYQDTWRIPTPPHDVHLVVVASGPAVTAPFWPIAGGEKKFVMGATNPVWIDADGDGRFSSAFDYASRLVAAGGAGGADGPGGANGRAVEEELAHYDAAIAAQYASLYRARVETQAQEAYERLLQEADRQLTELLAVTDSRVKKGFTDYLGAAPKVDVRTRNWREEEEARLKKEEEDRKKRREEREKKKREDAEKKRKEAEEKKKSEKKRAKL